MFRWPFGRGNRSVSWSRSSTTAMWVGRRRRPIVSAHSAEGGPGRHRRSQSSVCGRWATKPNGRRISRLWTRVMGSVRPSARCGDARHVPASYQREDVGGGRAAHGHEPPPGRRTCGIDQVKPWGAVRRQLRLRPAAPVTFLKRSSNCSRDIAASWVSTPVARASSPAATAVGGAAARGERRPAGLEDGQDRSTCRSARGARLR